MFICDITVLSAREVKCCYILLTPDWDMIFLFCTNCWIAGTGYLCSPPIQSKLLSITLGVRTRGVSTWGTAAL